MCHTVQLWDLFLLVAVDTKKYKLFETATSEVTKKSLSAKMQI